MSTYIFDIETGPKPTDEIGQFLPDFEAPSNYRDQEKIAAYIAEKQSEWFNRAALSAVTGKVLAIGYIDVKDGEPRCFATGDERENLELFWKLIAPKGYFNCRLVGFHSNRFDLPFIIRRSWALGIKVPDEFTIGRWLPSGCIDIADTWACGNREDRVSLDTLAKFFGVGAKNGSGADFAKLFSEDRDSAIEYLFNDLRLTHRIAQILNLL